MSDLSGLDKNTVENRLLTLERMVGELKQRTVNINSVDELSDDLGDQRAGRFLALISGSDPTDPDASGSFMSADGETFGDWLIRVGEVLNGQLQAGFGNGALIWAGGDGTADADGINLNGLRYAMRHYATDLDGNNARYGRLEMLYPDGCTIPSLALSYADAMPASELMVNGDFEMGDLSNWTPHTAENWSASPDEKHDGEYAGLGTLTWNHLIDWITSDRVPVTALNLYQFQAWNKVVFVDGTSPSASFTYWIRWYDDPTAGALIRAEIFYGTPGSVWDLASVIKKAPVGAQSVTVEAVIELTAGGAGVTCLGYFDTVSIKQVYAVQEILFIPEPAVFDGTNTRKFLAGVKELWAPKAPTIALVSTSSGLCTTGYHLVKIAFGDPNGSTLCGAASNQVYADSLHRKITVPLEIGPWGTNKRYVFMNKSGNIGAFYLAATIDDNTTTTIDLSVADASLIDPEPIYDTSGSRPQFPRSCMKLAHEINTFNAAGGAMTAALSLTATAAYFGFALLNAAADANDGDRWKTNMLLEAGTYTFVIYGVKAASFGKFDLVIDHQVVASGNDAYAGSTGDYTWTLANISVPTSNYHLVELVVNGKNASSSDYRLEITYILAKQANY